MKKKKWPKVLIIIASILVVLVIAVVLIYHYLFGGIKHVTLDKNDLGIEEDYYDNAGQNAANDTAEDEVPAASAENNIVTPSESNTTASAEGNTAASANDAATAVPTASSSENFESEVAADGTESESLDNSDNRVLQNTISASSDAINPDTSDILSSSGTDNQVESTAASSDTNNQNNGSISASENENITTAATNSSVNGETTTISTNTSSNGETVTASADSSANGETVTASSPSSTSETAAEASSSADAETTTAAKVTHKIKNIAIFGMSVSEVGGIDTDRSDMNLIVSIDQDNNRVCLTSILRDSKVPIEGHDAQKINAAYKYGGATLAIKTLNQNFHLNISDYITVNFEDLIEIVDDFGGVDIELSAAESSQISGTHEGLNTLTGKQAEIYASIRHIDSDFYRASRQQTIIMALLDKIRGMSKEEYPAVVHKVTKCIETSLTDSQIWEIIDSIDISTVQVVQNRVPDYNYEEGLWGGIDDTGSWVYVYDLEEAASRIHRIIYEGSVDGAKTEEASASTSAEGATTNSSAETETTSSSEESLVTSSSAEAETTNSSAEIQTTK